MSDLIERLESYALRPNGWAVVPCDLLAETVRLLRTVEADHPVLASDGVSQ